MQAPDTLPQVSIIRQRAIWKEKSVAINVKCTKELLLDYSETDLAFIIGS